MLGFWVLFLVAFLGFVASATGRAFNRSNWPWFVVWVLFTVAIGFRHEVGGDWFNYLGHLQIAFYQTFNQAVEFGDPGYQLLNWLAQRNGLGIYSVNTVCAAIVMTGVVIFARQQPLPWLAFLVAVPYTIMVVAMGYTRQSAALGFELIALTALSRGRYKSFAGLILAGALFHHSAVLLIPIVALASVRNRIWTAIWAGLLTLAAYFTLVADVADQLWELYVARSMVSEGARIRVLMNGIPAAIFLAFRRKLVSDKQERRLWSWLSIIALLLIPLTPFAATAIDRVGLYLIPIQMYVFSRLHRLQPLELRAPAVLGVVTYYALVQWVWLNYAAHAAYWVPYRNILL